MQTIELFADFLRSHLLQRPDDAHKGIFGHALIIAGQYGMAGAAVLTSRGCLRSGVGKVSVHVPRLNNDILQISVPEAIVHHDSHLQHWTDTVDLTPYNAVAVGPGIGTDDATAAALHALLEQVGDRPLVLDADALNILAAHPEWQESIPAGSILTPHRGEYQRLAGDEAPAAFAVRRQVYLVDKGHPTMVYTPRGSSFRCPWGDNGMATAGSGDVLTGLIAGLLAQGHNPESAVILGVSLHALAGNAASLVLGTHSVIASDIIEHLPKAFAAITNPHPAE